MNYRLRFFKISLPKYRQLPNACGLSAFLMLIDPEENTKFKKLLNDFFEEIEFLIPRLSKKGELLKEYKWSVVLNYLLLKVMGENLLSEQLNELLPEFFLEDYQVHIIHKLNNENSRIIRRLSQRFKDYYYSYFDSFLANPYVLERDLNTMKKDVDLRVLFGLFGGEYIHQTHATCGAKGEICFSRSDFEGEGVPVSEKLQLLFDYLQKSEGKTVPRILLNLQNHWVSVTSINIEKRFVLFNDPKAGRESKIKINKRTPSTFLFYLYELNPDEAVILKENVMEFLVNETDEEMKELRKFLKAIVENFEEDIKESID